MGLTCLSYPWRVLIEACTKVRADQIAAADRKEKSEIARLFNDRYTYRKVYQEGQGIFSGYYVRRGYAWMCPECNTIHAATEMNGLTGLHYPDCCSTREGHRLYHNIRSE